MLASLSGPYKVVYMSSDYTYGLTYRCNDISDDDRVCSSVTIDVISRTRELTQDTLSDIMHRVEALCALPSKFRVVDHTSKQLHMHLNRLRALH
jgi:hypothetical protein